MSPEAHPPFTSSVGSRWPPMRLLQYPPAGAEIMDNTIGRPGATTEAGRVLVAARLARVAAREEWVERQEHGFKKCVCQTRVRKGEGTVQCVDSVRTL